MTREGGGASPGRGTGAVTWREGDLGRLHLDRPRAINALTLEMIRELTSTLREWRSDDGVRLVALTGEGDRGLCAGGDIRFVRDCAVREPERVLELWREEYALDLLISTYPKPVVALADGITMGGGIGLAGHASHTVLTPRSRLAMPEVRIGLAPDVAGLWLLARAPGELGTQLALTGESVDAAGSLLVGWADRVVPVQAVSAVLRGLRDAEPEAVLDDHSLTLQAAPLPDYVPRCFGHDSVGEILVALDAESEPAAQRAAADIRAASPTAVAVTLAGLRRAAGLTVEECLLQDYRLSSRFLAGPDLPEGIRAQVVDKDRDPRWVPATLEGVSPDVVASFFEPAPGEEALLEAFEAVRSSS